MKLHWQEWFAIAALIFFVLAHSLWAQEPAALRIAREDSRRAEQYVKLGKQVNAVSTQITELMLKHRVAQARIDAHVAAWSKACEEDGRVLGNGPDGIPACVVKQATTPVSQRPELVKPAISQRSSGANSPNIANLPNQEPVNPESK